MLMKMDDILFSFEEVDDQHPVGFLSVLEVLRMALTPRPKLF